MSTSEADLAKMALTVAPLTRALTLAEWTGAGRDLTASGVLRPAMAVEACELLGISVPPGKLRSAKDVPELDQAWLTALSAGLISVTGNRASAAPGVASFAQAAKQAAKTGKLDDDLAGRVLLAWLRGTAGQLGFPAEPCGDCFLVLHELAATAGSVKLPRLAAAMLGPADETPASTDFDLDRKLDEMAAAEHAVSTLRVLADFGAATGNVGRVSGGTASATPLGGTLSAWVFTALSPPAADTAEDLVAAIARLSPRLGLIAAAPWLAARTPQAAVRELLDFAAACDVPDLRFLAVEVAKEAGAEAIPAWREFARRPGFGAYARQWLAEQGEPVTLDDNDEPWLLVEMIALAGDDGELAIFPRLRGAETDATVADALARIAASGHPHAQHAVRLLSAGRLRRR